VGALWPAHDSEEAEEARHEKKKKDENSIYFIAPECKCVQGNKN
jgi:hypothetical protein